MSKKKDKILELELKNTTDSIISLKPHKTKAVVIHKKDALKVLDIEVMGEVGNRLAFARGVFILLYLIVLYGQSFPDDVAWMTLPIYDYFGEFNDVVSVDDWYAYVSGTVMPSVIIDEYYNGDGINETLRRNLFLDHDRLISPVFLIKEDSPVDDCDGIGAYIYPECYDEGPMFGSVFQAFDPVDVDPESYVPVTVSNSTFYTDENNTFYMIPYNINSTSAAVDLLSYLKENLWITRATRGIKLLFVLYNGNENFFLKVELSLSRRASAFIVPEIIVTPAKLEVYEDRIDIVRLVFEIILTILAVFMAFLDLYYKPSRITDSVGKSHYFSPGIILPSLFYISYIICVFLWILFLANFGTLDLGNADLNDIRVNNAIFSVLQIYFIYTDFSIFNITILLLLILSDLGRTSSLGVVSKTLQKGAVDILYFLVIFIVIAIVYVFVGFYYFASVDAGFRTPIAAAENLFLWLLGEVDFERIFDRRPIIAHIYAWSWVIFGCFILISMLIAMVMEAYMEVKKSKEKLMELSNKSKTLSPWSSLSKYIKRRKKGERFISNSDIKGIFTRGYFAKAKIITKEDLEIHTDWTPKEIKRIMKRFGKSTRALEKRTTTLGELKRMLAQLYQAQHELNAQLNELEGEDQEAVIPYDFYSPAWIYENEILMEKRAKKQKKKKSKKRKHE
eukprot:TRINITY_DN3130_c0_g1_i1.p1 TRINITY_DN3130_c0_g1~~TRINITY_DN3130_c0_g1_i1.p1  ORF type:complete len:677 (-),score=122.81 TRINITY_DN3130_c0_g1_i1:87-2117(-)